MLVMNGPFIDCNHEDVIEGEVLWTKSDGTVDCLEFALLMKNIFEYLSDKLSATKV